MNKPGRGSKGFDAPEIVRCPFIEACHRAIERRRDVAPWGVSQEPEEGDDFQSERGDLLRSEGNGFGLRWAQVPNQKVIIQQKEGRYE